MVLEGVVIGDAVKGGADGVPHGAGVAPLVVGHVLGESLAVQVKVDRRQLRQKISRLPPVLIPVYHLRQEKIYWRGIHMAEAWIP